MTINQVLAVATQKLQKNNIPNPNMDAEILLARVLKCSREYLITHFDKNLNNQKIRLFEKYISRRVKGEPIAYIMGHKEFYGLDFFVNKNVLVPRPETELIVDEVLRHTTCNMQDATIIDVGTGSGCVIISLVKNLKSKFPISNFQFLATDISKPALTIARKNAKLHHVDKKIRLFHGDLLKPIIHKSKILNYKSKMIITANLPYGWNSWKNNCSMDTIGLKFEPPIALFTENKGLKIIEGFLKQIKQIANSKKINFNSNLLALIEFDPRQTIMLKKLIKKILPDAKFKIKKDLSNHNRLAKILI